MENASKALIIAGAILLAIMLISLGLLIFTQAQSAVKNSGMSDAEVQAFNQKFTKYTGAQKGSTIRAMVQEVMSNNNSDQASDETRVSINTNNTIGSKAISHDSSKGEPNLVKLVSDVNGSPTYGSSSITFSNTKTYTVDFVYYNGRVAIIEVK